MSLDKHRRLNVPHTKKIHEVYVSEVQEYLAQKDLSEKERAFWESRKRRAEALFKRFSKKEQPGN